MNRDTEELPSIMAELEESADTIGTEQCVAFRALSQNTTNLHQCEALGCVQYIEEPSVCA